MNEVAPYGHVSLNLFEKQTDKQINKSDSSRNKIIQENPTLYIISSGNRNMIFDEMKNN